MVSKWLPLEKSMNKLKILIISATLAILGCSACTQANNSVTITPHPTLSIATIENISPTQGMTSTVVASPHTIGLNCTSIIQQLPTRFPAVGKVVLSGALNKSPSYLVDLNSGAKTTLPQEENKDILYWSYSVSPNRHWLSYRQIKNESSDETLHIVTSDGIEKSVIPIDQGKSDSIWLDDTHLLVAQTVENWSLSSQKPSVHLIALNPFTREKQALSNSYPNIMLMDQLPWGFFDSSRLIYNSTLTRVVYPTLSAEYQAMLRLIDTKTNAVLADVPTTDFGKYPSWSPDGKQFAFATKTELDSSFDELFVLSDNGELTQLTLFSETYDFADIRALSWSTDGQQLAFLVSTTEPSEGDSGDHLATINIETKDIHEYCNMEDANGTVYVLDWAAPIWSPNDKYILLNLHDPKDAQQTLAVILDRDTGNIYQISENYQAVGWLK
jgi:WD40 repeat protein